MESTILFCYDTVMKWQTLLALGLMATLGGCYGGPLVDRCPECRFPGAEAWQPDLSPDTTWRAPSLPQWNEPANHVDLPRFPTPQFGTPVAPGYIDPGRCVRTAYGYSAC